MRKVTKITCNDYIYGSNEFYLCYKCSKDFEKFIKNEKDEK